MPSCVKTDIKHHHAELGAHSENANERTQKSPNKAPRGQKLNFYRLVMSKCQTVTN